MSPSGRPSRRSLLRLAAATTAATATGATGCSADDRPIQVAVVWSGAELTQFRAVVQRYDRPVRVISAGDDIDALLRARVQAGTTPDVAILPRPGLVTEYAGRSWLSALDGKLAARSIGDLGNLLNHNRKLYGVWVKAAHKSLFWYLPSQLSEPPLTWDELVERVKTLGEAARHGAGPAPLSVGAADGWVLTDWFENVLAGLTKAESYHALARGEGWSGDPVKQALDRLAELWSVPGAFPGGGRRALLTQYEESVIQVVHTRRAAMVFEGDFVESVAQRFPGKEKLSTFPFPGDDPGKGPLVVGGDAAVVFRGSRTGVDLVEWLTNSDSFSTWINAGGYLSPNRVSAPADPRKLPLRRKLTDELSDSKDLRFDLSDQLPGAFTGADGVGIWRIMQDFFADVTDGRRADASGRFSTAVTRAVGQLVEAARQAGSEL